MLSPIRAPCAAAKNHLFRVLTVALLSLWAVSANAAPKTDIVLFKNGDRLTGELISLKRGRLNLNTHATGTIGIEWDKVEGVISDQHIQVETGSGIRYFGTLTATEGEASVIVVTNTGPQSLDPNRVIVMSPIEGNGPRAIRHSSPR